MVGMGINTRIHPCESLTCRLPLHLAWPEVALPQFLLNGRIVAIAHSDEILSGRGF